jgi:hypothetical protein
MNQTNNFKLTPGYITGLTQTDGSFSCGISISANNNIVFSPNFTITADLSSKHVLDLIKSYFNCGRIYLDVEGQTTNFIVSSRQEFINILIPHFKNYPLFCAKLHAFNLLVLIINDLVQNKHMTLEGRKEIVRLALSMNTLSTRKSNRIKTIYSALNIPQGESLSLIENKFNTIDTPITNDNLAGIIDGDGSF